MKDIYDRAMEAATELHSRLSDLGETELQYQVNGVIRRLAALCRQRPGDPYPEPAPEEAGR